MEQVYKIDETRIDGIRKRALIRNGKLFLIVFLFVAISEFGVVTKDDFSTILISLPLTLILVAFSLYIGTNRLVKSYRTLEIILNDRGVEQKAEMIPYKQIAWANLTIEEKANGTINLYDNSVSTFMRKMYGRGVILVQPETMDRDKLLRELQSRSMAV